MQIDTSTQNNTNANPDRIKQEIQESIYRFMNRDDIVKRIERAIAKGNRFTVDIDEIRQYNPDLAKHTIENPIESIKFFEDILNGIID